MPRARASLAWVSSPRSCLRFLSTTCFRSVEPFACAARSTRATRRALLLIVLGSCCACFAPPTDPNVTTLSDGERHNPLVPCGHNCLRRRVHNPSDGGSWVRLFDREIRLSSVSPPFDVDFLALKRPSEPDEFDPGMACGRASIDGGTHARSPSEVAYVRRRVSAPSRRSVRTRRLFPTQGRERLLSLRREETATFGMLELRGVSMPFPWNRPGGKTPPKSQPIERPHVTTVQFWRIRRGIPTCPTNLRRAMRVSDEAMGFVSGVRCRTPAQTRRENLDRWKSKGTMRPKSFTAVEADETGGPEARGWLASFAWPMHWRTGVLFSGEKAIANLPQDAGMDDVGRWRWPLPAMTVRAGGELVVGGRWALKPLLSTVLHKRIEGMRARIDVLPRPHVTLGIPYYVDGSTLLVEATTAGVDQKGHGPSLRLTLRKQGNLKLQAHLGAQGLRINIMRSTETQDSILSVGGSLVAGRRIGAPCVNYHPPVRIESLVVDAEGKGLVQSWKVFQNSSSVNRRGVPKVVALVPGHYIDPGYDTGAPGEREQGRRVADKASWMLKQCGWQVLRPDQDLHHYSWLEYNRWVNHRTLEGIPIVEIHGQGRSSRIQGQLTGVIGQRDAPLNNELASSFGFFPMNWRHLRVARNGGTVLEAFNTDKLKHMTFRQRVQAAHNLAALVASSIVRSEEATTASKQNIVEAGCSLTGCPRE